MKNERLNISKKNIIKLMQQTFFIFQWKITAKGYLLLEQPPYSPELTHADRFLFPNIKNKVPTFTLTQETFQKSWEGVVRTISKDDFATDFRRWFESCQ